MNNIWQLIKGSSTFFRHNLGILNIFLINYLAFILVATIYLLISIFFPVGTFFHFLHLPVWFKVKYLIILLSLFFTYYIIVAQYIFTAKRLLAESISASRSLFESLKLSTPILVWSIIFMCIALGQEKLGSFIASDYGQAILPISIGFIWQLLTFLVLPTIAFEKKYPLAAFSTTWQTWKKTYLQVGQLLGISVILELLVNSIFISMQQNNLFQKMGELAHYYWTQGSALWLIIGSIIFISLFLFLCLYVSVVISTSICALYLYHHQHKMPQYFTPMGSRQ